MGSLLARAYKRILSGKLAQDAGEHWVTVNAGSKEGGEGGGSHVLLDGEGRVVAGMGGKFKGQNIDRIERKKFINSNAWNRQRKALTEKASDTERSVNHLHVKALMDPEKSINWHTAVGQKNLEKVLDRSKADTTGMGLINKLHTGIDAETELMRIDKEQKERAREEELKKLDETIKREQARREYLASPEGQAEEKRNRLKKEVAYRKNERLKEQQRQDELQKLIRGDRKDFADQNLHTPEAQAFYFGTFNKLDWELSQKSTEERNKILADARAEYEKVKGDISEKTRANIDEHLEHQERATAILDRLRKNAQKQQEAPKANYKETEIMPMNHDYVASSVKAKLENSTRNNPRIDLGLALMSTLDDIPAGTFVKGKDGGPMYKKTTSGWVIPGLEYKPVVPDLRAFESKGDLTLGIGKTADEAKANTKTTELQALKKHDAEQLEKAEREKAEKAEREERSKDFYLNKIDKIKDRISNGENYSAGLYKSELYKSLLSKANHGNVEEVNRVLNELKKEDIYTDRHRIWGLADVAKQNADYIAERHEKADKTTTALKGATVNKEVYNGVARTSVKFDNIPNYATRVALKQNGFKWNADAGEWYKSEGENGTAHESIVNALKDQGFNEQPKTDAPTGQQTEEQPRDMKNAFSDKYQKSDNSNLNKYQKVDNISNNKNTENGVTNMNTNQESQATPKTDATASMGIKDYEGKANINPRVATYIEDMGLKLSKDQYDKIATDYPPGNRSGGALALAGRDMRALQAFTKEYAKEISNTIADQEAAFEDVEGYHDFKGGSITISKKGDYLGNTQHASISFAGKPSEETRSLLKKNGFTYNPRYKTWENTARLGANKHEKILQTLKDGVTIESTQQATPTAQPRQATPTQQAEGKQYEGTGIENKNGRYEISFNEFPSYKLRTDMKNNGFKWDPNAKVWHTTDREKLDKVMSKHFTERT